MPPKRLLHWKTGRARQRATSSPREPSGRRKALPQQTRPFKVAHGAKTSTGGSEAPLLCLLLTASQSSS